MDIVVLEQFRKSTCESNSKIKAGNVILNITSLFGNSQVSELFFYISEQKILKAIHEAATVGTLAIQSDK